MSLDEKTCWIPEIGMEFETEDQAWQFWVDYSGRMGFNVRRQYWHKSRIDQTITSVVFVCTNEGHRKKNKRDDQVKNPRAETRTGCKVRLVCKFIRETKRFKIVNFVSDHNHLLQRPQARHLLRSQREVTETARCDIDLADESGIRPKQTHELMGRQVGGRENLTYTLRDQRNYLRDKRQRILFSGDAVAMLNYFHERVLENPSFQHVEQVDETREITNIFWADAKMIADYARFGDVVAFDTTFGTNKELRPFGVFVGFNHFREIVIFGATFMYDQTADSFEWVFKTFLETHSQKKPKTIFTDQDISIGIALGRVMPETTHGLCSWHIMENAGKHLMRYNKNGMNILGEFKTCMYEYEEEAEFEKAFSNLVEKVSDEDWLPFIYAHKEKWAYCYMKHAVTLGMRSTQLCESINKDIKNYLRSDMDIIRALKNFEKVVTDKRENEIESEFEWRKKLPKIKMAVPVLHQVGSLYTPKIFELFQKEYELSTAAQTEGPVDNEYIISICSFANSNLQHKSHKVLWDQASMSVSCGCKKFERVGILCWHALRLLDAMNIKLLPEKYILKRWTKEAEEETVLDRNGRIVIEDIRLDMTRRNRDLCRKFTKIAAKAAYAEELFAFTDSALNALEKQIEEKMQTLSIKNVDSRDEPPMPHFIQEHSQYPPRLKKKEGKKDRKRKPSLVEKIKKTKRRTNVSKTKPKLTEIGNPTSTVNDVLPQIGCYNSYAELLMANSDVVLSPIFDFQMASCSQDGDAYMNMELASLRL